MRNSGDKSYSRDIERLDHSAVSEEITIISNVNYITGETTEHALDIYFHNDGLKKPILIDIHGGGFISHDKKVDSVFANVMAQNGFVVFSLNYRLAYPKYTVFDQIDDISEINSNLKKLYYEHWNNWIWQHGKNVTPMIYIERFLS